MDEIISKILKVSNREDYYGKILVIKIIVVLLTFAVCIFGGIESVVFGHTFMLMWVSCTTCQLFNLHERKKNSFVWVVGIISKNQIVRKLFCAAILQNVLFLPVIGLYMMILLKAAPIVAVLTAIVHFFFAIAVGAFFSTLFRFKYAGLGLTMLLYLFYILSGSQWTGAELFRILSPDLQLYNMYIIDTSNAIGLTMFTLLACIGVWIGVPLSIRKISAGWIATFICALLLFLSVGSYEVYRNQKIFNSNYNTFVEENMKVSYREIDQVYARYYAKMFTDIDESLYQKGVTSYRLGKLSIQKYYAPIYIIKARRIPFAIEGDTMFVNVFSNAMLNTKDANLMFEMFYRMASIIAVDKENKSKRDGNTDELIFSAINEAVQRNDYYSDEIKIYTKSKVESILNSYYNH